MVRLKIEISNFHNTINNEYYKTNVSIIKIYARTKGTTGYLILGSKYFKLAFIVRR